MSSNIENINYSDFKNICRLCMFNCDVKFYLDCVVSSIFHKLTDLHFETNDDLPQQVCGKCFEKINEIQEFIFKCKQTHTALMECLNNFKQVQIKQEVIENTDLQGTSYNIKEEITTEEYKFEFVKTEHDIDDKSEVSNEQNKIESDDDLFASNTSNVNSGNDEGSDCNYTSSDDPNIIKSKNKNDCNRNEGKQDESFSGERPFKCEQCSKSFNFLSNMKVHMRTHTGERPFKCEACSKSFSHSATLKKHMLMHTDERPFKCDQCSKSFSRLFNLQTHMRTHTDERPFKCEQCSKSFAQLSSMKAHKRMHSGERPFKCNQCLQSFSQLSTLKNHMLMHTGERSFKCNQCSKLCSRKGVLKRHMLTHSVERPFECDQCSKSFTRKDDLKKHVRTHTGERPFKCDKCSKSFTQLSTMKTHISNNKCNV